MLRGKRMYKEATAWLGVLITCLSFFASGAHATQGQGRMSARVVQSQSIAVLPDRENLRLELSGEPNRTFSIGAGDGESAQPINGVADSAGNFEMLVNKATDLAIIY